MAGTVDKFDIKMVYPTRQGGREWFIDQDIDGLEGDSKVAGDLRDDIVSGNNDDGFVVGDQSQVRLHVAPDSSLRDASNTKLDQSTAKGRGYAFGTKDWDMRGLEVTTQMKCTDFDTQDSRFIIKGPSGSHRSNTQDCSGSSYGIRIFLAPSGTESGSYQYLKEQWHVHYVSRDPIRKHGLGSVFNKWTTVKYIIYLIKSTDGQSQWVKIETWLDIDGDGIALKKIAETVDKGGWGDASDDCGADSKSEIITWDSAHMTLRWDGPKILIRRFSIREIDPTKTIDAGEPAQPPTSGTTSRDWILKQNIISFPIGSCNVGQDTTDIKKFYDIEDTGSASNLHKERYRVGVVANGSNSFVIGKMPRRVKVRLSKTGSPPSGDITVVMRKGTDDTVAVTYTYTGGTLNASALTGSPVDYIFENLTSNYAWTNGDRLLVEYSSNTSDIVNEVNVFRNTDNPIDGAFTCAIKFDAGGTPPVAYSAPDTSRDYAWEISE